MRSKAVILHEQGKPPTVEEVEVLPPQAGEVMVRVAATGVCHSDYNLGRRLQVRRESAHGDGS